MRLFQYLVQLLIGTYIVELGQGAGIRGVNSTSSTTSSSSVTRTRAAANTNSRRIQTSDAYKCLDTLQVGFKMLPGGDRLCNGRFSFGLSNSNSLDDDDDGGSDLIIWKDDIPIWSAGFTMPISLAKLQVDGNFIVKNDVQGVVWRSKTNGAVDHKGRVVLRTSGVVDFINHPAGKFTTIGLVDNNIATGGTTTTILQDGFVVPPPVETCVEATSTTTTTTTTRFMLGQFLCSSQYRFGLDLTGNLGLFTTDSNEPVWSTQSCCGRTGDLATLNADGQLVLTNDNDLVWSSRSTSSLSSGSFLLLSDEGQVSIKDLNNQVLWSRTPLPPKARCRQQVSGRLILDQNEWICSDNSQYRFGLVDGDLSLWENESMLWSAGTTTSGDRMILRDGGRLAVLEHTHRREIWDAGLTGGNNGASLVLNNDGAVRIVSAESDVIVKTVVAARDEEATTASTIIAPMMCLTSTFEGPVAFDVGEFICNEEFSFGIASDGFLVLKDSDSVLWKSPDSGNRLVLDQVGGLHLLSNTDERTWSTGTSGFESETFQIGIKTNGNVLVSGQQSGILWSSAAEIHGRVVPDTLYDKVMTGYQGWFHAEGDGGWDRWQHWSTARVMPSPDSITIDMWPDLSEYQDDELYPTALRYANGTNAAVYSAHNRKTVERHTQWMQEYGIDGLFLQRFIQTAVTHQDTLDTVLANVRSGSETYGRTFCVMYDVSNGDDDTMVDDLINDWMHLVDDEHVTNSSQYLFHKNRPLLAIWGLGIHDRIADYEHGRRILDWFEYEADDKYKATLMGGVPAGWRDLSRDSKTDEEWLDVYRRFDVISPWTVGRMKDEETADVFTERYMIPDKDECDALGIDYLPVVFPGFSSHHLTGKPLNEIPRNGGTFLWRQLYNSISQVGSRMVYVAMFDEVDEGTAIFKVATTLDQVPIGVDLVTLETDTDYRHIISGSDHYLRLVGKAGDYLRNNKDGILPNVMPV